MNTGHRIKEVRIETGLTQQALTDAINALGEPKISRAAVTQWETRPHISIEAANLIRAAKALNVLPEWLQFGTGRKRATPNQIADLTSASLGTKFIPVLNYKQAGCYMDIDTQKTPSLSVDDILARAIGPYAFAMVVMGDSMLPVLKPGDYVIIDPDTKPQPGDIVAAKMQNEDVVTLKKYRPLGRSDDGFDTFELIPFNEDWPKITVNASNPGHIIGTLVEQRSRRRLQPEQYDPQYAKNKSAE